MHIDPVSWGRFHSCPISQTQSHGAFYGRNFPTLMGGAAGIRPSKLSKPLVAGAAPREQDLFDWDDASPIV
jgi:hypothetical protein